MAPSSTSEMRYLETFLINNQARPLILDQLYSDIFPNLNNSQQFVPLLPYRTNGLLSNKFISNLEYQTEFYCPELIKYSETELSTCMSAEAQ